MIFKNKYNMSLEENIMWAKRNIVDYIYKSANLEGITVTYPETASLYDGMTISRKIKIDDVVTINNLKYAWRFVLGHIDYPLDYSFICKVNKYVGGDSLIFGSGSIRTTPVRIGGTNWKPDIPNEFEVKSELKELNNVQNATDRALSIMLYCMRKQIFVDGNKRTSMLIANKIMIENGCGVVSIPVEDQDEFRVLLIKFYETNNGDEIKQFIYNKCIDGIDLHTDTDTENKPKIKRRM